MSVFYIYILPCAIHVYRCLNLEVTVSEDLSKLIVDDLFCIGVLVLLYHTAYKRIGYIFLVCSMIWYAVAQARGIYISTFLYSFNFWLHSRGVLSMLNFHSVGLT